MEPAQIKFELQKITQLKGEENLRQWKSDVRLHLRNLELWDFIQPGKARSEGDAQAYDKQ